MNLHISHAGTMLAFTVVLAIAACSDSGDGESDAKVADHTDGAADAAASIDAGPRIDAPPGTGPPLSIVVDFVATEMDGDCDPCFTPPVATVRAGGTVTFRNNTGRGQALCGGVPMQDKCTWFESTFVPDGEERTSSAGALTFPGTYEYFNQVSPWATGTIMAVLP